MATSFARRLWQQPQKKHQVKIIRDPARRVEKDFENEKAIWPFLAKQILYCVKSTQEKYGRGEQKRIHCRFGNTILILGNDTWFTDNCEKCSPCIKLSESVSLWLSTNMKYRIWSFACTATCHICLLNANIMYMVHMRFFLWTVYLLSFLLWWLWYWLGVINFNYSFSKPICLTTIFILCIAKAWKIETLCTPILQRDAVECHTVVCAIIQQIGRLLFWNSYPHTHIT